jgi:hypothetical protein
LLACEIFSGVPEDLVKEPKQGRAAEDADAPYDVASALAQKARRDGYSVYYTRTAALFRDLNVARADGSLRQLLKRLNRIDVLAQATST